MPSSDQVTALPWVYMSAGRQSTWPVGKGKWPHACQFPPLFKSTCPVFCLANLRLWMNSKACWVPNQCYLLSTVEPLGLYLNVKSCLTCHWPAHESPAIVKSSSHLGWKKLRGKGGPRSRASKLLATERKRRWSNTSVFYHLSLSEKQRMSKGFSV